MKIGALASSLRLPLLETFDAYRQMGLQGVQIGVNMEFLPDAGGEHEARRIPLPCRGSCRTS